MKVLYDAKGFDAPYSGVACYLIELLRHLGDRVKVDVAIAETNNPEMAKPPFNFPMAKFNFKKFGGKVKWRFKSTVYRWIVKVLPGFLPAMEMKNERLFRMKVAQKDYDLIHLTGAHYYGSGWRSVLGEKPIIITVHDINEVYTRNKEALSTRPKMLSDATHIIAISQYTKNALISSYGVPSDKISVIYHGCTEWPSYDETNIFAGRKYILYVGMRDGYKNFLFFIKAIAPYLRRHTDLSLVCTGKPFTDEESDLLRGEGIMDQVTSQFIPNEHMYGLYRNAEVFVYPSKREGFGIPIIDAFNAGCPVVLSKCSCFPEIGADAALYFDDGDANGMCRCIDRMIYDRSCREEMVKRGKARAKSFSWEIAASKTAEVYDAVSSSFRS